MGINLIDVSNLTRYQIDSYEKHIYIQIAKPVWQAESSLKWFLGNLKNTKQAH